MRDRAPRALRLAATAVLLAAALPARAQISPGPLSRAHRSLEGIARCRACHGIGERSLVERCLECHGEIAALRRERHGLHGAASARACAVCHPEHAGRETRLVRWEGGDPAAFDHARAGWALEGRHARLRCALCHRKELRSPERLARRPAGAREETWLGLETDCASCHRDPHEGRLGIRCADCHTAASFALDPNASFDHDRTRYPLRGRHVAVRCERCHDPSRGRDRLPPFRSCASCHEDPHGGRATLAGEPVDCAACHGLGGFSPSTYTRADHATTGYPLEGRHAEVPCTACHLRGAPPASAAGRARAFAFHPRHERCSDCHADAHAGQLATRPDGGACSACHGVGGFSPSRYTTADHDRSRFPLRGRHRETACRACHGPERPGLPPLPGEEVLGRARVALHPIETSCRDCHRDPHGGRFEPGGERPVGRGCSTCHDERSFRVSRVDAALHARFAFPLRGAHRAVPCLACHRDLEGRHDDAPPARSDAPAPRLLLAVERQRCRDCHRDPHGGQFAQRSDGGRCSACHGEGAFVPTDGFDHDRDTAFPLEGAHARAACRACHPAASFPDGTRGARYRPTSGRCEDCHASVPPRSRRKGS